MVFLTALGAVPLFYATIIWEEKKDISLFTESSMLTEHKKAINFFMFLFAGFCIAFAFFYVILPKTMVDIIYNAQSSTIQSINIRLTGSFSGTEAFWTILLNNIKVMIFSILFSFIYGFGAIFILTWNASVIGTAIGNFIRVRIEEIATSIRLNVIASYFHVISLSLLRYLIHGIFEVAAYFIAGLAGGIISVAVINHHYTTKYFQKIVIDSLYLIMIAIIFLIGAAFIEVYITPLLF